MLADALVGMLPLELGTTLAMCDEKGLVVVPNTIESECVDQKDNGLWI